MSALSVGGLIKHVAATERTWMDDVLQRNRDTSEEAESSYHDGFRLAPGETLAGHPMVDAVGADLTRNGVPPSTTIAWLLGL